MISKTVRVFFIGRVKTSEVALKTLISNSHVDICGLLTDRTGPSDSDYTSLTSLAKINNIPIHYSEEVNQDDLIKYLNDLRVEILFVIGWSSLLPKALLKAPLLGCIGYHPSELPLNRGRHPIIWALALGLKKTASSFFFLEERADSGPIISQKGVVISNADDAHTLYKKLLVVIPSQLNNIIESIRLGRLKGVLQDQNNATYWRKRTVSDGIIDWRMSAENIYNLVRALTKPYLGAQFSINGKTVKLWRCEIIQYEGDLNIEPGKILSVNGGLFHVKVGDGVICLTETSKLPDLSVGDYL